MGNRKNCSVGLTIGSPTEQATTPLLGFAHSDQPTNCKGERRSPCNKKLQKTGGMGK